MIVKSGEKAFKCLACGHEQVEKIQEKVWHIRCDLCQLYFMTAKRVRPTQVRGTGLGGDADLGLALLMEMGAGAPDEEKPKFS